MKKAFIIFTRLPIPGHTKTRLEKNLTKEQCAELHKNVLKDLNETVQKVDADIFISYAPIGNPTILSDIFTIKKEVFPQSKTNIWQRMNDSMTHVFNKGYDRVVLVGADIPELSYEHINSSFDKLADYDIVITPTKDHGYCLIGSNFPVKEVFEMDNVSNCDTVYENTIKLAKKAGYRVCSNSELLDLDEQKDLIELIKSTDYKKSDFAYTLKYLKYLGYSEKDD